MAQFKKSVFYKNAVIDAEAGTLTEITNDGEVEHQISDILSEWNGIDGITLTIQVKQW